MHPLANAYVTEDALGKPEAYYPLRPYVCSDCGLVQLPEFVDPDVLFGKEYAYFSGQSDDWIDHCAAYARDMTSRITGPRVLEIASNDGTLLRQFPNHNILGIEPARNIAWYAQLHGVPTVSEFFGRDLAKRLVDSGYRADLVAANNVIAHVPDLDDFLGGIATVLAPEGFATFEFPDLKSLINGGYWDTIYHEHFSYISFSTVVNMLERRGLLVFDVQRLPTHGGSLRVFARGSGSSHPTQPSVAQRLESERNAGLHDPDRLAAFAEVPGREKVAALEVLSQARKRGPIIGYGAAAKGNSFLNYVGVGTEMIEFVMDSTPAKQNTFLPGSHIPVVAPKNLDAHWNGTVLILAWNWASEILRKLPPSVNAIYRPFVGT